jgi:hypothetical protein
MSGYEQISYRCIWIRWSETDSTHHKCRHSVQIPESNWWQSAAHIVTTFRKYISLVWISRNIHVSDKWRCSRLLLVDQSSTSRLIHCQHTVTLFSDCALVHITSCPILKQCFARNHSSFQVFHTILGLQNFKPTILGTANDLRQNKKYMQNLSLLYNAI